MGAKEDKKRYTDKHKGTEEYKAKAIKYTKTYADKVGKEEMNRRNRERSRKRRKNNPELYMLYDATKRAKKKGLPIDITVEDIVIPVWCPVFDVLLKVGEGKRTDFSPSLDRVDNSKGYIKGNVRVISHRANAVKNSATVEELELIIHYMKEEGCLGME